MPGITGCQITPSSLEQFEESSTLYRGNYFEHRVSQKATAESQMSNTLIIVIEGDGQPWTGSGRLALDPTSGDPLMLKWFQQWQGTALYVGRPCYYGARAVSPPPPPVEIRTTFKLAGCAPYWFTLGRYSEPVVASLAEVIEASIAELEADVSSGSSKVSVILLGHSGGGTLSMLLAARLTRVVGVITLAGNLDVSRWQRGHGYTPLIGSLDPAELAVLPDRIRQLHVAASEDEEVHPDWIREEAERQRARYQVWKGKHREGWEALWPELNRLVADMVEGGGGD
ncbi:hypothetical protein [Hahella ganghwensis]|uniref:hypothetical protein n=1 Tax=Hahella ganghwensis TaxID=286420 RepID=UPI00039B960E|nr:hypothetical protein [Hahella ganghwensis]